MKTFILILLATLCVHEAFGNMSEAQMKAAVKLIRNVCQPKFKATNEQIKAMHKGDWEQDRAGQCYMWCIMNMYKLITKDNKFDWEYGIATMKNQAPDAIRDPGIKMIEACKGSVETPGDKCAAAFEIARCMYNSDPVNYFLP